jgi:hypothetical protein
VWLWGALLAAGADPARAATFFVRVQGDDSRDGLTPATALRSIRAAAQRVQNPGDRVIVGPGEYLEGNIAPARSGILGRPVVFLADPTGVQTGDPPGVVRIVPQAEHAAGFLLLGKQFVEIRGFEIRGGQDAGVQVRSDATGRNSAAIGLYDLRIEQASKRGIDLTVDGENVISGCTVTGSGSVGINVQGVGVSPSVVLTNVRAERNGAHGLSLAGMQAVQVENTESVSNAA